MIIKQKNLKRLSMQQASLTPIYARNGMEQPVPKFELADQELAPSTASNLIHDELMLDGNARSTGEVSGSSTCRPASGRCAADQSRIRVWKPVQSFPYSPLSH